MSEDTGRILDEKDVKGMGRQTDALEKTLNKIQESKLQIQAIKIKGESHWYHRKREAKASF